MAVDMFLKLDGVQGDGIKGEIEVLSFSWGLSQTSGGRAGGAGAGKVNVSDFSIVKELDKASPRLMEMTCRGEHSPSATLSVRKAGDEKPLEYLKIKLSDVLISSYQTSGANSGVPMEQVSFSFSSVEMQTLNDKGQFEAATSCDFGGKH